MGSIKHKVKIFKRMDYKEVEKDINEFMDKNRLGDVDIRLSTSDSYTVVILHWQERT